MHICCCFDTLCRAKRLQTHFNLIYIFDLADCVRTNSKKIKEVKFYYWHKNLNQSFSLKNQTRPLTRKREIERGKDRYFIQNPSIIAER